MANSCTNMVQFTGEPSAVAKIYRLFSQIERDPKKDCHQLPKFIADEIRRITNLSVQPEYIYYCTPLGPNLQVLQQIADHFKTGFINRYREPDTYLWGEASYANGRAEDIYLDRDDLQLLSCDFDQGRYYYKGKTYDDNFEVLTAMLDDKIQKARTSYQWGR